MQNIALVMNKKDLLQASNRRLHSRAMMIWRQMENIYGIDWTGARGPRTKRDGSLSYVAKTWVMALGQYSDIHIRMALAVLAEQHKEPLSTNVITIFEFREIVERVSKR